MRKLIAYSGALAQVVGNGGLAWLALQFLCGFRRLGYDVLFIDRLDSSMSNDPGRNMAWLGSVLRPYGLAESLCILIDGGSRTIGRSRARLMDEVREAACLINVMGYCNDEEICSAAKRRVFLDIDPGFGQMWRELGLHDAFKGHSDFVTLGRNISRPDCPIPTCGLKWITMNQPVVLENWPVAQGSGEKFTSIGAWRGPNAPIVYNGKTYGLRVHEFRKFAQLPKKCPSVKFEMALDIHPDEKPDLEILATNGWSVVDPKQVAGTPQAYQNYIAQSRAELMIPKEMYVASNSGLLSDRSVYYLASGRPVLARDTGIKDLYPTGEGLLTFSTMDEAIAGVESIQRDYARHTKAARAIAEKHFDSDKVLTDLLRKLEIG